MASVKQLQWNDAHFCGLRSQTNIYSLSKITSDGVTKVLAASLDGHIASVEYQNSFNRLLPITKEGDLFSSVSSIMFAKEDAYNLDDTRSSVNSTSDHSGRYERHNSMRETGEPELVSIDISHTSDSQSIALAVAYLMVNVALDDDKASQSYMNIFLLPLKEMDKSHSHVMDEISESYPQNLSLEFIPFKLTHHKAYVEEGKWDTCFLLSGNDQKIHIYRQDPETQLFQEEHKAENIFPEFMNVDGCVTQMELRQQDATFRLSCLGTQTGLITVFQVNVVEKQIINSWTREFDSPVTSLHLFTQHTNTQWPDSLDVQDNPSFLLKNNKEENQVLVEPINLLVTCALDPSAVFQDVLNKGLTKCRTLPSSNSVDVVLCSCVMDTDFDGENEILIGTYGQVLIAYKLAHEKPEVFTSTPYQSPAALGMESSLAFSDGEKCGKSDQSSAQVDMKDKDIRRRHKSVAALLDTSTGQKMDKHDRHSSDEVTMLEDHFKDGPPSSRLFRSQENLASPASKFISFATPDQSISDSPVPYNVPDEYPCYRLIWTRRFCDPVMGLACEDVMGDGMLDLIVLSLKGLHILQPDLQEVSQLVQERLRQLSDPSSDADDDYHQLQTEVLHDEH